MRLAALLALTLAVAARADGPPATTDEDRKRGADLVAGWTARRDALLGEERLRSQPAGAGRLVLTTVEAAPPAELLAVYRVVVRNPATTGRTVLLLDAALAPISRTEEVQEGQATRVVKREARRPAGGWVREENGARIEGPDAPTASYHDAVVLGLVARSVPPRPATYELPGFDWNEQAPAGGPATQPSPVVVRVAAPAPHGHRGREVQAVAVDVWLGDVGPFRYVVADGRLLEVLLSAGVGHLIAEPTAEEDLAEARAAARIFIKVKVKALEPAALDEVVDWAALKASAQQANPALVDLPVEGYATLAKEALRGEPVPPGHDPGKAFAALDGLIKLTIQGDVATAAVDGGRVLFKLRRVHERWRVAELP